jgi:hypothetical protein
MLAAGLWEQTAPAAAAALPEVAVYRDPGCGCCEAWAQIMMAAGFPVSISDDPVRDQRRAKLGIRAEWASCHTALVQGFVIEGHVPPADIMRLLQERPAGAFGLAVPGMPLGSPGMEVEGSSDPYEVLLLRAGEPPEIFARY